MRRAARATTLEFFETPQAFVNCLFQRVDIRGRVFEPFVGTGAIPRTPRAGVSWVTNDLDPWHRADSHEDATTHDAWARVIEDGPIDWTISNPAFSHAMPAISHALAFSRVGVAMHLRVSIHEVLKTGVRRTFFHDHPPQGILFLPRFAYQRSPTTGQWVTDSVSACWVIWKQEPYKGPQFIEYAPEWVIDALDAETPSYRARMDALAAEWARPTC